MWGASTNAAPSVGGKQIYYETRCEVEVGDEKKYGDEC